MAAIPIDQMQARTNGLRQELVRNREIVVQEREVHAALESAYIRGWRDAEEAIKKATQPRS